MSDFGKVPRSLVYPLIFGIIFSFFFCMINRPINNLCYFIVISFYALTGSICYFYLKRNSINVYRVPTFLNIFSIAFFIFTVANVVFDKAEYNNAEIYAIGKHIETVKKYNDLNDNERITYYKIDFELPVTSLKCVFCYMKADKVEKRVETLEEFKKINRGEKRVISFREGFLKIPYGISSEEVIYRKN